MKKLLLVLLGIGFAQVHAQKFPGLASTPPLGWNSWNTFQTHIDEKLVMQVADSMVSSGMRDAGYQYLVLDDGWMAKERDPKTGNLIPDPKKFPNGLEPVISYVHQRGLKFGLYNCAGTLTCAGYPGTRGYEYQDARYYASLQIDYLKYDWCYTEGINAREAYRTMSAALRAAGRPILFSLCEWGTDRPWEWASEVGHCWRISGDIFNCFDCIEDHGTWKSWGVTHILDMHPEIRGYAGKGHWNDLDMLEVGNGMRTAEDRSHFSLWAFQCSPLMAGNDIRSMSPETKDILTNRDIIGLNQDTLGIAAFKMPLADSVEVWIKPLSGANWGLCFLNRSTQARELSFNWKNWTDTLVRRTADFSRETFRMYDCWSHQYLKGTTKTPFRMNVPAHDVLVIRLTPASGSKK